MKLTIQPANRRKATVLKHDSSGGLIFSDDFTITSARDQKRIANAVQLGVAEFVQLVGKFLDGNSVAAVSLELPDAAPAAPVASFVRRFIAGEVIGRYDTFDEAVRDLPDGDQVIQWAGTDSFACLDIDFHDRPLDERPNVEALEQLARSLRPAPHSFNVSRGRGVHCYYERLGPLTARHLAAAAALAVIDLDRSATVEIKHDTRVPVHPWHKWYPSSDIGTLTSILHRSPEDGDAELYLESRGMVVGGRYPHSYCPFCPDGDEKRDPVVVLDSGIFCHSCASKGVGFLPWNKLSPGASAVESLVGSFTHWEHAALVLADKLPLPTAIARSAYEALLIREHGAADPRIPRVFQAGRDMIRADGRWVGLNWRTTYRMGYAQNLISELPAVQSSDGEPVKAIVDRFRQDSVDLSSFGYFPVVPVRGCRIYGEHLAYPDPNRVTLLTHSQRFQHDSTQNQRPRYVKPAKRMNLDAAWEHIDRWFPGVNRPLIELLIAAKGIAEAQVGLPPFIMLTGPTGSGKSGSIHIAAGITADSATEFEFTSGTERTRQGLLEAIDRGTFAVVNEVFKPAILKKLGGRAAIDPILNFTPQSTSHKLYVGPVQLGRLPVLCLTDTDCPSDVYSDVQIGRRVVYVRLPYRIEWERPAIAAGGQALADLRFFDETMPAAANAILSSVIDRFFLEPIVFVDIARALGFETLERTTEFADQRLKLREFFDEVVAAPAISATEAARLPGPGWKKISRNGESDLDVAWLDLCDGEGEGFSHSRACEEADWSIVLGVSRRRIDFKCSKKSPGVVFVRFLEPSDPIKVNEDILQ